MSKKSSAKKAAPKKSAAAPQVTGLKLWLTGARLRTLPLALAPVALGTGVAATTLGINWLMAGLALAVALLLQVGVNYANDYSDGVRGTDANRVGPLRLTGSGSAKPEAVKFAALLSFALACAAGLAIVALTAQWWMLLVGAAAVLAAWFYTGGKSPYGYAGLGEIAVFIFFGLVATAGTAYIQTLSFDPLALIAGAGVGGFATAVLLVNNIRDIRTDAESGKKTIAVRMGARASKAVFLVLVWVPMLLLVALVPLYPATFLGWSVVLLLIPITLILLSAKTPRELILVLKLTSYAGLAYGVLIGLGLAVVNFTLV